MIHDRYFFIMFVKTQLTTCIFFSLKLLINYSDVILKIFQLRNVNFNTIIRIKGF